MEKPHGRMKKSRKRERPPSPVPLLSDDTFFPLMLAASVNIHNPHARSLVQRLQRTHLAFIKGRTDQPPSLRQILPRGLLSLIPLLLLIDKYPAVAVLAAEMVGAVALCSLEANMEISVDSVTVGGLVTALGSSSKRVVTAACNAILDLSTALIGRERLIESAAIEKLLSVFCQVVTVPVNVKGEGSNSYYSDRFLKDKLSGLVLDAAIVLINACNDMCLEKIPGELSKTFLLCLKQLWVKLKGSPFTGDCGQDICCVFSTRRDLAESVFRLSMNQVQNTTCPPQAVKKWIFGSTESEFVNFLSNCWEDSPILLRSTSKSLGEYNGIFSSLLHSFDASTTDAVLDSILQGSIACPPLISDELDILKFLKEVGSRLGSQMLYDQDIRVVKTQKLLSDSAAGYVKKEVHLFKDGMGSMNVDNSDFVRMDHVQKCKEAFQEGYTIALRGFEFRNDKIAALADGLATVFGQPSVGANMYLTPPRSQGLSRHCDDHCVFVCQLLGCKEWVIFPPPTTLLPRLYEPLGNLPGLEFESDKHVGTHFSLQEGDILYIPRGYPHEAYTAIDETEYKDGESPGISLHLTLGIEVESPFEWEGFAHVALHCWNQKQKQAYYHLIDPKLRIPNIMLVNLLHVAIRLISDHDPAFRKACMVAAFSLPSDSARDCNGSSHALNQKAIFSYIISRLDTNVCFYEAFRSIEAIVQGRDDDSLQWMRWLQHLPQNGDENEKIDFNNPLKAFEELVQLSLGHAEEVEAVFVHLKFNFCRYVSFEDACKTFEMLHEKYKKPRKQYMNGMLYLHSTL